MYIEKSIRLYGIDTPEIRGEEIPEGLISRDWLREKLNNATEIYVSTHKDKSGKYGRLLGTLFIDKEIISINNQLVQEGLAVFKTY